MTSPYFIGVDSLGPNDCQLNNCRHEDREIKGLVAIVEIDGYSAQMHPDCGRIMSQHYKRQEIYRQARERALEN